MLAHEDLRDAVASSDSEDFLDRDVVPVATVAGDNEFAARRRRDSEDGSDEVLEVVLLLRKHLRLLAQATRARLLVLVGRGADRGHLVSSLFDHSAAYWSFACSEEK